jgi:oligopeptide transport system substrate-binding protein
MANIEGARQESSARALAARVSSTGSPVQSKTSGVISSRNEQTTNNPRLNPLKAFGVEAISDHVLRVRLRRPDMNFPALVAHPVFRPVKLHEEDSSSKLDANGLISNGAFSLAATENARVLLERANTYWNKDQVTLQQVSFVNERNAESALAAYRSGEIDAVTNAAFEPLVIKLLTPYEDFHRNTYGALTYYSFNNASEPFDDVRVREALAIAIDRDRISADEMGGATEPAKRFLPETVANAQSPVVNKSEVLEKEYGRARELLAEAGFPGGKDFPRVRLLINRNEQQRLVAQSIATMWRTVLNIETDIVIKNWDEYEAAIREGDYDVVRRGLVMQTTDELTNIRMLFPDNVEVAQGSPSPAYGSESVGQKEKNLRAAPPIESESQALRDLTAMPIYFASSYSLVKPYVMGFDGNVLDAPSLKNVRMNTTWTQSAAGKDQP